MSHYHGALRDHWYQDDYPGAVITPNCGVIHTTENAEGVPDYAGGSEAPNYTANPLFAEKRLEFHVHFPDERSSRALVNLAGGVETNTLNALQIELVGTCDPKTHRAWARRGIQHIYWPEAPDWALRDLAAFVKDMHDRHGIPITSGLTWEAYDASYGADNGVRMSNHQWLNFTGWCGHQHVPENLHGDPGALPWDQVQALATGHSAAEARQGRHKAQHPAPQAAQDPHTPRWDHIWEAAHQIAHATKPGHPAHDDARTVLRIAADHSTKH